MAGTLSPKTHNFAVKLELLIFFNLSPRPWAKWAQ